MKNVLVEVASECTALSLGVCSQIVPIINSIKTGIYIGKALCPDGVMVISYANEE